MKVFSDKDYDVLYYNQKSVIDGIPSGWILREKLNGRRMYSVQTIIIDECRYNKDGIWYHLSRDGRVVSSQQNLAFVPATVDCL